MFRVGKLLTIGLITIGAAAQIGCRACGTCYDYSCPVAECACDGCSTRSGSVSGYSYAGADEPNATVPSIAAGRSNTITK
ncbi:MAG: hypothetical protein AAGF31_13060 [Planctomycetota bacterium]